MPRENPVALAIKRLGGLHEAVLKTRIPGPTLAEYRRHGKITDYERVKLIAELSGVAADDLAGIERSA